MNKNVAIALLVYFSISPLLFSQNPDGPNLQKRLEMLDAFFRTPDGIYKGRYEVIREKKITVSEVILYAKGNLKSYHFFSKSRGRYAVLSFADKWYFFDLLRKKKILLEDHLRREPAGDTGFPPVLLYGDSYEKNYQPEKIVSLSTGAVRIFARGLLPESFRRISVEWSGDRPVLTDFYDENLVVYQTLRYEFRNELLTPRGEPADLKNFPDKQELLDLRSGVIGRLVFHEYDSRVPEEYLLKEIKGKKGFFYAPQTDHTSISR